MFVLTIDQRSSRTRPDLVPDLLDQLHDIAMTLPFVRTVGDEIQGVTDDPHSVLDACSIAMRDQNWSVGIGVGEVESPLPTDPRQGRGPAFLSARDAVEQAKKLSVPLQVLGDGTSDVAAMLRLLGLLWIRRSERGWEAIEAVTHAQLHNRGSVRKAAAKDLGITEQALSERLRTAAWQVEEDALPLAAKLLEEIDS